MEVSGERLRTTLTKVLPVRRQRQKDKTDPEDPRADNDENQASKTEDGEQKELGVRVVPFCILYGG